MTKPVSLAARRWDNGGNMPSDHSVRDTLEAALARIDNGDINPAHIIICHAGGEGGRTGFMQGGNFTAYAQLGLMMHIIKMMEFGE